MTRLKVLLASIMQLAAVQIAIADHTPSVAVSVTIDTSKPGPQINRELYGQFIEHEGTQIYDGIWVGVDSPIPNIQGYRKDVVEALRKLNVPVIRWPGGCFADQYDWRDGIGPRERRPVRANSGYNGTVESNAFGTHEFLNFAELIGAESYVSLNMGSMTPLDASRWLEYMTSDKNTSLTEERRKNGRAKPWKVRYVGLGNEVWGCGGYMEPEFAAAMTRRTSYFVSVPTDQTLIKVASGPSANLGADQYERFAEVMMKNASGLFGEPLFQGLSLHYYSFPIAPDDEVSKAFDPKAPPLTPATGFGEDKWANMLRSALGMEHAINSVSAIMDKYDPEKKVSLVIDEWGSWHKEEPGTSLWSFYQQSSLLDAEVTAISLNIFHRHTDRVKMANNSEMVNALHAIVLTEKERMLLTPTYYVFEMYLPFQGATPYPATMSGAPYNFDGRSLATVDISAAKGQDGKLYLALVNLDPHRSADVVTNLSGKAHGMVLTGPAMDTHNTFNAPQTIYPVLFSGSTRNGHVTFHLPAKAVAVVAFD